MLSEEYKKFREAFDKLPPPGSMPPDAPPPEGVYLFGGAFPIPDGVEIEEGELAGIPVTWARPQGAPKEKLLLYYHGGGFQPVPPGKYLKFPFVAELAARSGWNCVTPDYRLTPEVHFPVPQHDCFEVYKALLAMGYDAKNIGVTGESAGGHVILTLWQLCKLYGVAKPGAFAALSPAVDLTGTEVAVGRKLAPDADDLSAPLISPRYGDYRGLKRIFIQYGTDDLDAMLAVPGKAMMEEMRKQGVDVVFDEWPGLGHAFATDVGLYPEADEACQRAIDYLKAEIEA